MIPRFLRERFQPKGELEMVAPDSGRAGESLPIEVRLRLQEEAEPRQARLELVGRETYYERRTNRDSRGHSRTRIVRREADFSRESQVLQWKSRPVSGTEHSWTISVAIPPNAPSTCRGRIVDIRWILKGVLDVPRRLDLVKEVPLQVQGQTPAPAVENLGGDAAPATSKGFEECNLVLTLEQVALAQGQELRGNFRMEVMKQIDVRGITVQLVQAEDAGAKDNEEAIVREQLAGPGSFSPRESYSYDFVLALPLEIPPTAYSPHSSLVWWVEAVLDRPMRTDFSVSKEVYVYMK